MEKLTPEEVVKMLKKEGEEVTVEEAVIILEFLRKLSSIVVAQHMEQQRQPLNNHRA